MHIVETQLLQTPESSDQPVAMVKLIIAVVAALAVASLVVAAHGRDLPPPSVQEARDNGTAVVVAGSVGNYACNYHFEVQTGHTVGAGTDSVITFGLYRHDGSGWYYPVDGSHSWHAGMFEEGRRDTFDVNSWCMHPCKLSLQSNGAGPFPDWYCSWVRVTVTGGDSYQHTFHVNEWVGPNSHNPLKIKDCHHGSAAA